MNDSVVKRRIFQILPDLDETDPTLFDEGVLEIEEEVEPSRRQIADAVVARLSPSAYALYLAMQQSLAGYENALSTRLDSSSCHLLVACCLPSDEWSDAAIRAFRALIAIQTIDRPNVTGAALAVTPEGERNRSKTELPLSTCLSRVRREHVIACFEKPKHLTSMLAQFCDAVLDLSSFDIGFLNAAIARQFDAEPATVGWSADLSPSEISPDLIDDVCRRATDASSVAGLLWSINLTQRVERQENARNEAAETARKTSTSSSSSRTYTPSVTRPVTPKLDELHGYGAAQRWGMQLAEDLSAYADGEIEWSDVDAGALLFGPPGTGKTLFASALAATCGVAFIATSYAQWQSSGDGHLGYVTKALRATFEAANNNAPCILFIDEVDTIRGRGQDGGMDGWWSAITTALLECLDGTARREGVVVIAACNRPDVLDEALVRSGRLDRRFEIGLPDEDALLRIFGHHLRSTDLELLAPAATVLAGSTSGADVARIAREARRVARKAEREVEASDLLSIAMPAETRSPERVRLIAIHEAGHAIASMENGRMPDALSLVQRGAGGGYVQMAPEILSGRLVDLERDVVMLLAGRAAEEVVYGEATSGASADLRAATAVVTTIVGRSGLGGQLSYADEVDRTVVEARLRDLYSRTLRLVGEHRGAVERLADLAVEHRVLGKRALAEFAAEHGFGAGQ